MQKLIIALILAIIALQITMMIMIQKATANPSEKVQAVPVTQLEITEEHPNEHNRSR